MSASTPTHICFQTTRGKHYCLYRKTSWKEAMTALEAKENLLVTTPYGEDVFILFSHIVAVYVVSTEICSKYKQLLSELEGER